MGGGGRSTWPESTPHEWVPLQDHPIFTNRSASTRALSTSTSVAASSVRNPATAAGNLAAWDASSSRLYLWDPYAQHLHRLSLHFPDDDGAIEPQSPIQAASPSEILVPDTEIRSKIQSISVNPNGSGLLLLGDDSVSFMNLYERSSSDGNRIIYRTSKVGSRILSADNGLQTLQVSWHPYSSTHVGVLSSDSVLRLFDLSSDLELPEQEFYLQPFEPGSCQKAVSICPVAFSFGDEHLWDRFSVFVLFSDGSTYVLCPVIPFGSLCSWAYIEELREDVSAFGLKSSNANVISNSNLSLGWLESTFPEIADQPKPEGNRLLLRAHPYAPVDASLALQGPLGKVQTGEENDNYRACNADCEGKAIGFLYNSVGKDSILVIAWSSGQLQIDALADEVQPLWNVGSSPHLRVDSYGHVKGVAMICETKVLNVSASVGQSSKKISGISETVCCGPPLLRLATVDLALPRYALDCCQLALFSDPLVAERFYCLHGEGIDSISLHFLPFSNLLDGTDKIGKEPSVNSILTACHDESCSTMALCGYVTVANICCTHLVGITTNFECIMLENMGWTEVAPLHYNMDVESIGALENTSHPEVISRELLTGPKAIVVPPSATLRSLTADTIEGRSTLHQYIKLFHENYVEYAHKVYVELEHHEKFLKTVIDEQLNRVDDANQSLLNVQAKEQETNDRISLAFKKYELLEQRLQSFRKLPRTNKKPLSIAEREFKAQLERFADVEMDALSSSIESLNGRLRRFSQSSPGNGSKIVRQSPLRRKNHVSSSQIQQIRSTLEVLSGINSENTKKIDLIEHGLKNQEA